MRWPWERRAQAPTPPAGDTNSVPAEYATEALWIESLTGRRRATVFDTAAAEAAAGLWARALSAAEVSPAVPALAGVTPAFLAWAGRALILNGECVALIEVAEGMAKLRPCLSHDVTGSSDPEAWRYRCDVAGPTNHRTRSVAAAGVVHLRWAVRRGAPWIGLSPIRTAFATGRLHARATTMASHLADPVFTTTTVSIKDLRETGASMPTPEQIEEIGDTVNERWKEKRQADRRPVPFLGLAELNVPVRDKTSEAERELLESSAAAIFAACGIPAQLLSTTGEATIAREAWRLFYLSAVAPVARCVAAELRAKLHPAAMLGFDELRASDQDQISRAVERRARAYKALREAGLEDAEARRLAGLAE